MDIPKILERMVFGSSPLLSGVFVTFFLFQIEDLENSKSFGCEIMKKIPDIILDPDLECHLLTFNRLLVVFCHILSATGE